ncbi:DUF6415 family natural product biosynthesis protein [Streptomyces tsukubensis]|uniref:DUF6415 family natural product biosynthesis protein n=1 Tax=Streptomyces tsukubensis TaxID=83656 RepID=UPI00344EB8D8
MTQEQPLWAGERFTTGRAVTQRLLQGIWGRFAPHLLYELFFDDLERALGAGEPVEPQDIAVIAPRLGGALDQLVNVLARSRSASPAGPEAAVLARARRVLAEPFPQDPPDGPTRQENSRPAHGPPGKFGSLFYGPRAREAMARNRALTAPVSPAACHLRRLALASLDVIDLFASATAHPPTTTRTNTLSTEGVLR